MNWSADQSPDYIEEKKKKKTRIDFYSCHRSQRNRYQLLSLKGNNKGTDGLEQTWRTVRKYQSQLSSAKHPTALPFPLKLNSYTSLSVPKLQVQLKSTPSQVFVIDIRSFQFCHADVYDVVQSTFTGNWTSGPKATLPSVSDRHLNIPPLSWVQMVFESRTHDAERSTAFGFNPLNRHFLRQ